MAALVPIAAAYHSFICVGVWREMGTRVRAILGAFKVARNVIYDKPVIPEIISIIAPGILYPVQ
jgi:hypothetical protein